ncbi:hypothetical protein Taro_009452, partial [Colocasia esculenta]|nr:hypothetical protein [Colocasia esculenta]
LTSKRVKLLDMYGSQVAIGIVMSTDPTKMMGRPIGQDFCEVAILLANKPDSPLFIKDHNRKTMEDAIGSHILWFLEYVQLDFKRHVGKWKDGNWPCNQLYSSSTSWGKNTDILKDENKKLGDRVKDLEERIAMLERTESKFQEENDSVDGGVAPKESVSVTKQDVHSLISKRVKLLDMYGNIVAMGIVMSTDPTKIVMGRSIGEDFCEVAVLLANKPESPIFIKDDNRKTM